MVGPSVGGAAPNESKSEGVVVAAPNEGVVNVGKRGCLCCPSVAKADEVPVNPNEKPPVAGAAAETVN